MNATKTPKEKAQFALRDLRWDDYTQLNNICGQVKQEMIRPHGFGVPKGIVAMNGKEVVGGLVYKAEAGGNAVLDAIVVAKEWQGKDVGKHLMGEFLKRMAALDVREIRTRPKNMDAAAYFERHGFTIDESAKGLAMVSRRVQKKE